MDLGERFKIRSNSLEPKQGNILISEPLMNDFHFGRSVVLLIDHDEVEGSFGVIINKKLNASVSQIVDGFPDFESAVYLGGPVADNQLFFIHTLGPLIPDSDPILEGLYWGGDSNTLKTLISTGIANENNIRFYLGYAGWDSGQLVSELVRNSWLVSDISAKQFFSVGPERMWQTFVNQMGSHYEMWSRFPKNAEDN
ncbi:MAG: YqgE/AlgH family protein [Bacteroidales bacterium]|nr:YqgE/AlgH family protein [Bacteroidales bacterium]